MGPYSDELQYRRAAAIQRLLDDPTLSEDARRIWEGHLRGLSRSEEQYNARVRQIWTDMRNRYTEKWI